MKRRCRACEATMTPAEQVCISCGTPAEEKKNKSDAKTRFRTIIKYFMFITAGMSVASLFVDVGPSFATCASVTVVLFLALSSAQEMLIDREKD
jgi:hypothetical protein